MCRQGNFAYADYADNLAAKIVFFADIFCNRLNSIVHVPVKDMWNALNFENEAQGYNSRIS